MMNYEKNDLCSRFVAWYFNEFCQTEMFDNMLDVAEESPWHREDSVGIHTNMVVSQYLSMTPADAWTRHTLCGALACAFHDVGKPWASEKNGIKYKPERGHYKSFGGHELMSARMWENFAVLNYSRLFEVFGLTAQEIYSTGWIIEHHLPWGVKRDEKLNNMALSALSLGCDPEVFTNVLLADTFGRLSDDGPAKRQKVLDWIAEFTNRTYAVQPRHFTDVNPVLTMLIGASGTGKSSFRAQHSTESSTFSLDDLRMEWYVEGKKIPSAEDPYSVAFEAACADKKFKSRANQRFIEMVKGGRNIVVDNVNTSAKRRRWYITEARRRGYKCVAAYFPVALQQVIDRQETRQDKTVPVDAVERQYNTLQLPQYGEFDEVLVIGSNLI